MVTVEKRRFIKNVAEPIDKYTIGFRTFFFDNTDSVGSAKGYWRTWSGV